MRGLPPGLIIRALGEGDIAAATRLSDEARWNQVAEDWRLMLAVGEGIGIFQDQAGDLVATALTMPYGRSVPETAPAFGWISMVLVTSARRRHGLATWLLDRCIDRLKAQARMPVLDATPAGREVYCRLGFRSGPSLERYEAAPRPAGADAPPSGIVIRGLALDDLDAVAALDAPVFGGDRHAVLRHLALRAPGTAQVAIRAQRIVGFALARAGRHAAQIGPIVAPDAATAIALLDAGRASLAGPLFIDAFSAQTAFVAHLRTVGFTVQRPFTRMSLGGSAPGDDRFTFAAAGPELG